MADAIAHLRQAAEKDEPFAVAYTAVLAGLGEGEPQDWDLALRRLARAAELGSEAARGQLRVLSGDDAPTAASWSEVAAAVDLAPWMTRHAPQRLPGGMRVGKAAAFLPPAVCQWLVTRGGDRLSAAPIYDDQGAVTVGGARNNTAFSFLMADYDLVLVLVRAKIARALGVAFQALEPPQLLHYAPGESFHPHYDFLDPDKPGQAAQIAAAGQRVATFLIYLNEAYEGGATAFPELKLSFRGRTGDALFFANLDDEGRPDRRMLHAGMPPTSGEKWVLSQWIRDR